MINCSKFHQVRIKTKKDMEGGGGGTWTERHQKSLEWIGLIKGERQMVVTYRKTKESLPIYIFLIYKLVYLCFFLFTGKRKERLTNISKIARY